MGLIADQVQDAYNRSKKVLEKNGLGDLAREAIRPWESKELLLLAAVSIALEQAYEKGRKGLPLVEPKQEPDAPLRVSRRRR